MSAIGQIEGVEDAATTAVESGGNPLIALLFVVGGFIVGSILARIVRTTASGESRPTALRKSAGAISALAFSIVLIAALITALGILSPAALDALESDVQDFIPRALAATIVLVIANVIAQLVETGAAGALAHASPMVRLRVPSMLRFGILGFAVVIAANQLGIDTTIITIMVASVFFGLGLAAALLAGLGGRNVAGELAAGRALRQVLNVGDSVAAGSVDGIVAAIGSTTTQITTADRVVLVPNAELLSRELVVVPAVTPEDAVDEHQNASDLT